MNSGKGVMYQETKWTDQEKKQFVKALSTYDKDTPNRLTKIADMFPGKTLKDVIIQFELMKQFVNDVDAGLIPIPSDWGDYNGRVVNTGFNIISGAGGSSAPSAEHQSAKGRAWTEEKHNSVGIISGAGESSTPTANHQSSKGHAWTEEEHKLFLLGLVKYGKGKWREIADNLVTTRTPTQIATHSEKYFDRQKNSEGKKQRPSLLDITDENAITNAPPSLPIGGSLQEASEWNDQHKMRFDH